MLHGKCGTPTNPSKEHGLSTFRPILVSTINMLLRDEEFDSLESLCYAFNREPQDIIAYLAQHGYVYSLEQKQMRPKGYNE